MADQKLTQLDAATTLGDTDLVYVVDDVAGVPTSKKLTGSDLKAGSTDTVFYGDDANVARPRVGGSPVVWVGHTDVIPVNAVDDFDLVFTFDPAAVTPSTISQILAAIETAASGTHVAPATVPDAPTGLTATGGDGEVSLAWTASGGADGHRVYRHTADTFASATQVGADLGAAADSYTDTTAVNDTLYYYWITAFNTHGESDPSTVASATPEETATYFTDFSEFATGEGLPAGFTERWTVAMPFSIEEDEGVTGGKFLSGSSGVSPPSGIRRAVSWDVVPDAADAEVLFQWRAVHDGGSGQPRGVVRGAGSATTETGYVGGTNGPNISVNRYLNGAFTSVLSVADFDPTANTWYITRYRVNGTSLSVKTWPAASSEPAGWTETATNSDVSGAGWVGIAMLTDANREFDVDWIGVAIDGDTAQGPQ